MRHRFVTFKEILDDHGGIGPGFHILRLSLALIVSLSHAYFLAGFSGRENGLRKLAHVVLPNSRWYDLVHPFELAVIPMFYALSGFLVMGSAERLRSTSTFFAFRGLRLFPALTTEVVLSALVLGPMFTSLPLVTYFKEPGFVRYFGNIVGWVVFDLPGVFYRNPFHLANLSLWTIPSEMCSYAITAALMATGVLFRWRLFGVAMIIVTIILAGLNNVAEFGIGGAVAFPGSTVGYYFFVGLLCFQWREHIPHNWILCVVSMMLSYTLLRFDHAVYLAPVFLTYCTMFVGLLPLPKIKVLSRGDYSYGMYLYHFPITQAVIATFPKLRGHLAATTFTALCFTALFAGFSWHVIERPALMLKNKLPERVFPVPPNARIPLPEEQVEKPLGGKV